MLRMVARVVAVPVRYPTSLCFGGPDFETLFVTSATYALTLKEASQVPLAGAVLSLRLGVKGMPAARFLG
jgi:sugar lactone lactonase YvrE